jgi:murein DD-endopeptidase MepM/ murein hydrolase activator NlpD
MKYAIFVFLLVGVGCSQTSSVIPPAHQSLLPAEAQRAKVGGDGGTTVDSGGGVSSSSVDPSVDDTFPQDDKRLPLDGMLTYKGFGEYFEDRFSGYHVAIDLEAPADTPVYAIADGEVTYSDRVSGYGGVMVVKHQWDNRIVSAIYGHLDPNSMLEVGEPIQKGEQIAILGEEEKETDGEREHLHFAMYEGEEVRLNGYETNALAVSSWLNPVDELKMSFSETNRRASDLEYAQGEAVFALDFDLPDGWDIEYIPSIESLSLYTLSDAGTARERSQVLIRYFDASAFLTLSTVTIYLTEDLVVGEENYTARRYDIQKNDGVADFIDQPSWRNERHVVMDFRGQDGYTRYYVVAANPELDTDVYEGLLASMVLK